jgi:hypothetical protein
MTEQPLSHRIRTAPGPREAILMLAEAIDAINARLDAAPEPGDLWSWDENESLAVLAATELGALAATELVAQADDQRARDIEAVRQQLNAEHDGEERQALEARLRLLQDGGGTIEPRDQGKRFSFDGNTIDFVPASKERRDWRYQWAKDHELHTFVPPLDELAAADAFMKGGPLWLYEGNRAAIMMMPYEWRVQLVEDVALDSTEQAKEMGADILKSPDSVDQQSAVEAIQRDTMNNG